jgi:hypothetical protein
MAVDLRLGHGVVVGEIVLRSIEARWAEVIRVPVLILGHLGRALDAAASSRPTRSGPTSSPPATC